ncbi:hypothetical protein JCM11251_007893 [Rhodosporidiobolus azoricus]
METEEILVPELQDQRYVEPGVMIASSFAAMASRLTCHPLDTIRILVQTAPSPVPPIKELIPKPRLKSLYAGLPVALTFNIPAMACYLTTYEASKRYLSERWLPQDREPTIWQQLPVFVASGTAAELTSGTLWTLSDVLKSRLQTGREGNSAVKLVRKIVREEGWLGLQRGYWMGTLVFVPNISVYWCIYESLKARWVPGYSSHRRPVASSSPHQPQPDSPASSFSTSSNTPPSVSSPSFLNSVPTPLRYTLCSASACAVAACTTTPIEVVQARWQTSGGKVEGGIAGIVKELWRTGGWRAFTRGLGARVAYAIPANGISMTLYESGKRWLDIH